MVYDVTSETFDKGAKLLSLCYLCGSEVEYCAIGRDVKCFKFPQAFTEKDEICFGFSKMKTKFWCLLECLDNDELYANLWDICAGYQSMMAMMNKNLVKTEQTLSYGNFRALI